jgi:hypothetical protein
MQEETRLHVSTAIHGLLYAADTIDQALVGEKSHLDAQKSEHHGPFALALHRVAEIADGVTVEDTGQAHADLLFLFGLLHYLQGGFYSALWDILARAHEVLVLADPMTESEAKVLLGEQGLWLDLDMRLGHIHPLEQRDGVFRAYDATFLGSPSGEVRFARYELEARKRLHESLTKGKKD